MNSPFTIPRTLAFVGLCFVFALSSSATRLSRSDVGLEEGAWFVIGFTQTYLVMGLIPWTLVLLVERETRSSPDRLRWGTLGAALVVGALASAAYGAGVRIAAEARMEDLRFLMRRDLFRNLIAGGLLMVTFLLAERATREWRRQADAESEAAALEAAVAESRLRLMQAQIEPHFLFNSLATVQRLCERDVLGGRELLSMLGLYLRETGAHAQARDVSIRDELEMVRRWLAILQVRMGERLRVEMDVPEDILPARLPPLSIATLVENAVKHGLSPRATGGCIRVQGLREGNAVHVSVIDDGVGFQEAHGSGIGLANTRRRLALLFGDEASLHLSRNDAGGVSAVLRIPYACGA